MIYISKKVVFKKQSETLNTIVKDKQIQVKKKAIKSLVKTHAILQSKLDTNRQQYQQEKQQYESTLGTLQGREAAASEDLLRLKIRKLRLAVFEKPELRHEVGSKLKQYLQGWAEYKRYAFVVSVGGISSYYFLNKCAYKLETLFYIKPIMKTVVLLKTIKFWNEISKPQDVIVCVKKLSPSEDRYLLQVYSWSGKYFFLEKHINQRQYRLISPDNPIQNLLIIPNRKILMFLHEYFSQPHNTRMIEKTMRVLKFQMDVLRQRKKVVCFRTAKLRNIYESIFHIPGYENLQMEALMVIKATQGRDEDQRNRSISSNYSGFLSADSRIKSQYVFSCIPVKSYGDKYKFFINDENVLTNYEDSLENFFDYFLLNYMIQLRPVKKVDLEAANQVSLNPRTYEYNGRLFQQQKLVKHYNLYDPKKRAYHTQQFEPALVERLDFSLPLSLEALVRLQASTRALMQRKKYREKLQQQKSSLRFGFMCKIFSNIVASVYIKNDSVVFLAEYAIQCCPNKNVVFHELSYDKKYWGLAKQYLQSENLRAIVQNNHKLEQIQQQMYHNLKAIISRYEEEQETIRILKPIKAYNRLKKLFAKASLRQKRSKNILYIKKIDRQFATLVLIFRRSSFLKNIIDVNLYVLKSKPCQSSRQGLPRKEETQIEFAKLNSQQVKRPPSINPNKKQEYQCSESKIRYKTINIFVKSAEIILDSSAKTQTKLGAKRVEDQFYITDQEFVLKPLHIEYLTGEYRFIERFACISLSSEQVLVQLQYLYFNRDSTDSKSTNNSKRPPPRNRNSLVNMRNVSAISVMLDKPSPQPAQPNLIFYSLYRDSRPIFFIELYTLVSGEEASYFKPVHREEISKQEVCSSSWNYVYRLIAAWAVKRGLLAIEEVLNLSSEHLGTSQTGKARGGNDFIAALLGQNK